MLTKWRGPLYGRNTPTGWHLRRSRSASPNHRIPAPTTYLRHRTNYKSAGKKELQKIEQCQMVSSIGYFKSPYILKSWAMSSGPPWNKPAREYTEDSRGRCSMKEGSTRNSYVCHNHHSRWLNVKFSNSNPKNCFTQSLNFTHSFSRDTFHREFKCKILGLKLRLDFLQRNLFWSVISASPLC